MKEIYSVVREKPAFQHPSISTTKKIWAFLDFFLLRLSIDTMTKETKSLDIEKKMFISHEN